MTTKKLVQPQQGTGLESFPRMIGQEGAGDVADEHLLERFALHRDEAAFAALMERHGPMVLGVCQRILNHRQDAEDAFQATFLVLARKAASIRKRGSLDSWLYGVACRIAWKAKSKAAQRRARERQAAPMVQTDPKAEMMWQELSPVLDEELNRLPQKYRNPIVLCYLKGNTNEQAAHQLGWTKGTVSGRLARARELLRSRLARRGLVLSTGLLAGLLAQNTASAMPASLAGSTIKAAMAFTAETVAASAVLPESVMGLAQETLKEMGLARLKFVVALVLALLAGIGLVAFASGRLSEAWAKLAGGDGLVFRDETSCCTLPGWKVQATTKPMAGPGLAVAFSPDDRWLAAGGADRTIRLWDTTTEQPPAALHGHKGAIHSLAFARGEDLLASGSADHSVRLWDVSAREVRAVLPAHDGEVFAVAFAPDGRTLASGGADRRIRLWDATSATERATLKGHTGPVHALRFTRDGKTLISGSADQTVKIWDVAAGEVRVTLTGHSAAVWSVAVSPDGRSIASGSSDQTIRLWDLGTGRQQAVLRGHSGPVRSVAYSFDNGMLFSGGGDYIKLWEPSSGRELAAFSGHVDGVNALTCAGKSLVLASGGEDKIIRLWRHEQPGKEH